MSKRNKVSVKWLNMGNSKTVKIYKAVKIYKVTMAFTLF